MHLTFGSVATLAEKFGGPIARINPSDSRATLDRVMERKANLSAVANIAHGASFRQAIAGDRPWPRPAPHAASSGRVQGNGSGELRSTAEAIFLQHQVNFRARLAFFKELASTSNEAQLPMRLGEAAIQTRQGTGLNAGIVRTPIARDACRNPGFVVNRLANIDRNSKANLQPSHTSRVDAGEGISAPMKFSIPRPASPRSPTGSSGSDSGLSSPSSEILREATLPYNQVSAGVLTKPRPNARVEAPQSFLYGKPLNSALSPASSRESVDNDLSLGTTDSDLDSDFYGSPSSSSQPGSPDTHVPTSPWPRVTGIPTPPDSEADDVVSETTARRPATVAQCVRELRIIQRELFDMAQKFPDTERGITAWKLHSTNQQMVEVVGAGATYDGAVRLMPGIRSMSTVLRV